MVLFIQYITSASNVQSKTVGLGICSHVELGPINKKASVEPPGMFHPPPICHTLRPLFTIKTELKAKPALREAWAYGADTRSGSE